MEKWWEMRYESWACFSIKNRAGGGGGWRRGRRAWWFRAVSAGVAWLSRDEDTVRLYESLLRNYDVSQRDYHHERIFKGDERFQSRPPWAVICPAVCLPVFLNHSFTMFICSPNSWPWIFFLALHSQYTLPLFRCVRQDFKVFRGTCVCVFVHEHAYVLGEAIICTFKRIAHPLKWAKVGWIYKKLLSRAGAACLYVSPPPSLSSLLCCNLSGEKMPCQ